MKIRNCFVIGADSGSVLRLFLIPLLSLSLLLAGCSSGKKTSARMEIWAAADCPLCSLLEARCVFRLFEDEAVMLEACSLERPVLMLCSHLSYERLEDQNLPLALKPGSLPDWNAELLMRFPDTGSLFFPIGSSCYLLSGSRDFPDDVVSSSCRVDSFSALFCQALLLSGEQFHADREKDFWSESFVRTWNELATAAYNGLSFRAGPEPDMPEMPSYLLSTDCKNLSTSLYLWPGSETSIPATAYGLVCLSPSGEAQAEAFLSGLYDASLSDTLLSSGLIPAFRLSTVNLSAPGRVEDRSGDSSSLSALMLSLQTGEAARYPSFRSDYIRNRVSFDESFSSLLLSLLPSS